MSLEDCWNPQSRSHRSRPGICWRHGATRRSHYIRVIASGPVAVVGQAAGVCDLCVVSRHPQFAMIVCPWTALWTQEAILHGEGGGEGAQVTRCGSVWAMTVLCA